MGNGTESDAAEQPAPKPRSTAPTDEELVRRFLYHPPRDEQAKMNHAKVSAWTLELARYLVAVCPPGRNLSLALTDLESVRMRANAAIAVDDPRP